MGRRASGVEISRNYKLDSEEGQVPVGGAIEIHEVTKVFRTDAGDVVALDRASLAVAPGEFVSIIGPSGCGKTSLLRIVGDLETPTSGTLTVVGVTPAEARKSREIGVVFQSPALLNWRTVEENVKLPAEVYGEHQVALRVNEMIETVGLAGFEKSYPRELSGGMQSRVAIARALNYRPSVLLMDEPFGALDEITREKMQFELIRIWEETEPAVIFITHSISEALILSDRVVVMSARPGRILEDLDVEFPRPRVGSIRTDRRFVEMEGKLRKVLEEGESRSET